MKLRDTNLVQRAKNERGQALLDLYAARLEKAANKHWAQGMREYGPDKDYRGDRELLALYRRDVKALMKIAAALREGNLKKAARAQYGLDTSIRDVIPGSVFNFLDKVDLEYY